MNSYQHVSVISWLFAALFFAGCDRLLIPAPYNSNSEQVFDSFWNDVNTTYPFFEFDDVNWQDEYNSNRPKIGSNTSPDQLFDLFKKMLSPLSDGHIALYSTDGKIWVNERVSLYKISFSAAKVYKKYFNGASTFNEQSSLSYGMLEDSLLYIYIRTFDSSNVAVLFSSALSSYPDSKGMILDLRSNLGGLRSEMEKILGNFSEKIYAYEKIKTGPAPTEFTPLMPRTASVLGLKKYSRKIVLITNRYTASASENLVMALKNLSGAIQIGDTTYGAFSPKIHRILSDGISYDMSNSVVYDSHKKLFERIGLAPNVYISPFSTDTLSGQDPDIETAIRLF